ncbi:MAG: hypothetical protein RR306_04000 [Clostridia bacterium]
MKKIFLLFLTMVILLTFSGCNAKKPSKISLADKYLNSYGFKSDVVVSNNEKELFAFNFFCRKDEFIAKIISPDILKNIVISEKDEVKSISYNNLKLSLNVLNENQKSLVNKFCVKTSALYDMIVNSKITRENDFFKIDYNGIEITFDNDYKIIQIKSNEYIAKFTNFEFIRNDKNDEHTSKTDLDAD